MKRDEWRYNHFFDFFRQRLNLVVQNVSGETENFLGLLFTGHFSLLEIWDASSRWWSSLKGTGSNHGQ